MQLPNLGMEVYGYDPYISVNAAWRFSRNVKHITNVDTIFQECDYITVHVPLLESTKGMINKEKTGYDEGWRGDLKLCKRYSCK